jgi:hypoxia up-regulated 1
MAPSFRVKEIRTYDTQGYSHGIQYMFNLKEVDQTIIKPSTRIGAPKDIPFQMMGEFTFSMYQAVPDADGNVVKTPVLEFSSGNLTRAVTKLIDESKCDRESFNNYVQVRLSPITGTPEVTSAWVTCDAEVVEEAKGGIVDGIKGFFGGGKKDQEALKEGESSSESASAESSETVSAESSSSAADAKPSEPAKPTKKQMRSAITYNVKLLGYEKVPRKEMKRMQDRCVYFKRRR